MLQVLGSLALPHACACARSGGGLAQTARLRCMGQGKRTALPGITVFYHGFGGGGPCACPSPVLSWHFQFEVECGVQGVAQSSASGQAQRWRSPPPLRRDTAYLSRHMPANSLVCIERSARNKYSGGLIQVMIRALRLKRALPAGRLEGPGVPEAPLQTARRPVFCLLLSPPPRGLHPSSAWRACSGFSGVCPHPSSAWRACFLQALGCTPEGHFA